VAVEIPEVPAGRYLMVMYDGSEGGDHYTWDHVRVARDENGNDSSWWLPAVAGGLAISAALCIAVYRSVRGLVLSARQGNGR
jgi:hypothetical protein